MPRAKAHVATLGRALGMLVTGYKTHCTRLDLYQKSGEAFTRIQNNAKGHNRFIKYHGKYERFFFYYELLNTEKIWLLYSNSD